MIKTWELFLAPPSAPTPRLKLLPNPCLFYLQPISWIHPYLSISTSTTLDHRTTVSHLSYFSNLLIYTLAPSIYFPESNRNHLKHKGSHVTFMWQTLLNLPTEYWIKSKSLLMASRVLHGQLALVPAVLAHLSFSVCRALTHPRLPPMIFLLLVTAVLLHFPWLDPSLAYMSPLQTVLYILWR